MSVDRQRHGVSVDRAANCGYAGREYRRGYAVGRRYDPSRASSAALSGGRGALVVAGSFRYGRQATYAVGARSSSDHVYGCSQAVGRGSVSTEVWRSRSCRRPVGSALVIACDSYRDRRLGGDRCRTARWFVDAADALGVRHARGDDDARRRLAEIRTTRD